MLRFQLVVEVVNHLGQGQFAMQLNPARRGVVAGDVLTPLFHAKVHQAAHVAFRDEDVGLDELCSTE